MDSLNPLPQVTLYAGGKHLSPESIRGLASVRVEQRLSLPTQCELTFAGGSLDVPASLQPGTQLQVMVEDGRTHGTPTLFEGEVTAVEHSYGGANQRLLRLRCYDRLHRLRKRQSVRAFVQTTPARLARELTTDLGISVTTEESSTGDAQAASARWPRLVQHSQSDLDLLVEVASRAGLYLSLWEDRLYLMTLEGKGDPVPLRWGDTLLEADIEINSDQACRAVETFGWDPMRVTGERGRATHARSGRQVNAQVEPEQVGGNGRRFLPNQAIYGADHAGAIAQAELDRRAASEVVIRGVAQGNPALRPGTRVQVSGVDATVAGRYVLTGVLHTVDAHQGFVSEVDSMPPVFPVPTPEPAVALGRVSRVADPAGIGRVQVTLTAYDDVQTEWMHVVCPGAGPAKGLTVLPDVGDRVLVLFPQGHPGQGLVLGGLYGMEGPPDSGVEANAVRRYTLVTPGGQRIQLDDAQGRVRLENNGGSYVELSPDMVRVHAAADLEIDAPGRSVVIRGDAIDFQRG